ncbi:MAG: hypothetical protein MUE46_05825 [Xanthomonadales bacterium]|nr:hypothetical protein [Xanthomonadales bacterium]
MSALIALFALSIAALPAVLFLALTQRDTELSDASLYRQFVAIFALTALGLYGLMQEPVVQRQIDPAAQLAYDIENHPVLAALVNHQSPSAETIRNAVRTELASGKRLSEAVRSVHPGLFRAGRERLAWADAASALGWARAHREQLAWLQSRQVEACAALAVLQPEGIRALSGGLEPALATRFEASLIAVLESAKRGLATPHSSDVSLEEMQTAYRGVSDTLAQRHGEALARQLATPAGFQSGDSGADAATVCSARIDQLDAVLALSPALAARIATNLLR